MKQLHWEQIARDTLHPTQLAILEHLRRGSASPVQIAAATGESLGNVSYHMSRLLSKHLVKRTRTRPVRGALEHFYTLNGRSIK